MPGRHSLLWKLAILMVCFCLMVIALSLSWGEQVNRSTSRLSDASRQVLQAYADQAQAAWREGGAAGVDRFLERLGQQEPGWALVMDREMHTLNGQVLTIEQKERLSFVRQLGMSMGRQGLWRPTISIPFSDGSGRLVMQLPQRLSPWASRELLYFLTYQVAPGVLALLFGIALYRLFIAPLSRLREQAVVLSAGDLSARAAVSMTRRKDELGDLGRAFDHMADRLQGTVAYQRRLLRDLSHELRTPLSRLRVACESESDAASLRQRLDREILIMQRLVDNSLELAWLDSERPQFSAEPIQLVQLWDMLVEDACFETGWSSERLQCRFDQHCVVRVNLTSLAQALENLLRNAIRHSPEHGVVRFDGCREGEYWHLRLCDQGPGVGLDQLDFIFEPFARLDSARPGDGGFGLGLSIARSAIALQGGRLWAERLEEGGLCMHMLLPAVDLPE